MAISEVSESRGWIVVFDHSGKEVYRTGSSGKAVAAYAADFYVLLNHGWIVTYDEKGKELGRMSEVNKEVRGASAGTFNVVENDAWLVRYDKRCKQVSRRGFSPVKQVNVVARSAAAPARAVTKTEPPRQRITIVEDVAEEDEWVASPISVALGQAGHRVTDADFDEEEIEDVNHGPWRSSGSSRGGSMKVVMGSLVILSALFFGGLDMVRQKPVERAAPEYHPATAPAAVPVKRATPVEEPPPASTVPVHLPPPTNMRVARAVPIEEPAPVPAVGVQVPRQTWTVAGVAVGDTLNVHVEPLMNSPTVFRLANGESVMQAGESRMNGLTEWVPISSGGKRGWVSRKFLMP